MRFFIYFCLLGFSLIVFANPATRDLSKHYDPQANPETDLKLAITEATQSHRLILIIFGGDWCGWSQALDQYLNKQITIQEELKDNFVILKIYYSHENKDSTFFKKLFGNGFHATPYFGIADNQGNILEYQDTTLLEHGDSYSDQAFTDFINKWKAKRKDLQNIAK